jgi:hypothetical protein
VLSPLMVPRFITALQGSLGPSVRPGPFIKPATFSAFSPSGPRPPPPAAYTAPPRPAAPPASFRIIPTPQCSGGRPGGLAKRKPGRDACSEGMEGVEVGPARKVHLSEELVGRAMADLHISHPRPKVQCAVCSAVQSPTPGGASDGQHRRVRRDVSGLAGRAGGQVPRQHCTAHCTHSLHTAHYSLHTAHCRFHASAAIHEELPLPPQRSRKVPARSRQPTLRLSIHQVQCAVCSVQCAVCSVVQPTPPGAEVDADHGGDPAGVHHGTLQARGAHRSATLLTTDY